MFVKAGGAASPATRVIDDAHRPAILLARGLEGVGLAEFEDQEVAAAPIPIFAPVLRPSFFGFLSSGGGVEA